MSTIRILLIISLLSVVFGCASIPKEAPELSQEVGDRISAMKVTHLNLLHQYFDLKRDKVNEVFEKKWIPAYAKSFFSNQQVANYWDSLVVENDKEERLRFIVRLGPQMLDVIQKRRANFLKPLNKLESTIEDSIQIEYARMISANNTITSFLVNSSKVVRNRERYLNMLGIDQSKIDDYIDQVDKRSEEVMEAIREANIN